MLCPSMSDGSHVCESAGQFRQCSECLLKCAPCLVNSLQTSRSLAAVTTCHAGVRHTLKAALLLPVRRNELAGIRVTALL